MCVRQLSIAVVIVAGLTHGSPASGADDDPLDAKTLRGAIERAIPLLEAASAGSAEHRQCFTCHNQAIPVFALVAARDRGFAVDANNLQRQLDHTAAHLHRGLENYKEDKGQGGKVLTAGYALWTLQTGGRKPDETTTAVAGFVLNYQQDQTRWSHPGRRPPSSGSDFTATFVALRGLSAYGADHQQAAIQTRLAAVREWLQNTEPADTEDRVFRLRALKEIRADDERIDAATQELLEQQRDDGGWAQTEEMTSDPYATATVLAALLELDRIAADNPAAQRAARFLLKSQRDDGSWHVTTRAEPFQTYYETGYPHGNDQFISITAAAWATVALCHMLPTAP